MVALGEVHVREEAAVEAVDDGPRGGVFQHEERVDLLHAVEPAVPGKDGVEGPVVRGGQEDDRARLDLPPAHEGRGGDTVQASMQILTTPGTSRARGC